MEDNSNLVQNQVQQNPTLPSQEPASKKVNLKGLILLLGVIVIFGGLITWTLSRGGNNVPDDESARQPQDVFLAANSVAYGYWTESQSVINAIDLSTGQNSVLAVLPLNVKHVKVLSPSQIIYINETDDRDYGKSIVTRSIGGGENIIVSADEGFGIDDFVVSNSGQYIAVWEVSPPSDSIELSGGRSRVYAVDVTNASVKNLIYDETSGPQTPVHYPIGISDSGQVYLDRFLPNSEAGWAYGMSISDFTGVSKQNIALMQNGTYSTQPIISPDGTKVVFSGYDGTKGPGTAIVDGYRRAIVAPNTVEFLDLQSLERTIVASTSSNTDIFPTSKWDLSNGNIIFSKLSEDSDQNGYYAFDLTDSTTNKISYKSSIAAETQTVSVPYTSLTGGEYLIADVTISESALGNLGGKYAQSWNAMQVYSPMVDELKNVNLNGGYVQFIALRPQKYFPAENVGLVQSDSSTSTGVVDQQLQLQTFTIKPTLAPVRQEQQSGNRCRDVAAAQCNELLGRTYTGDQARGIGLGSSDPEYASCFNQQFSSNQNAGTCSDSPLYLYGASGTNVKVYVGTQIYNTNVKHVNNLFNITLQENGAFLANGQKIDSLEFDYNPSLKRITKPNYGVEIEGYKLASTLKHFAKEIGLNEKETVDLLAFATTINAPYVFVSFYDDKTSKQILPIQFDPVPDNYSNIVFYYKKLDKKTNSSYDLPKFEKVKRGGFTALEISHIVE